MTTEYNKNNESSESEGQLIPLERDVKDLIELTTYQGMTDVEIEKVIQYKIEQALRESDHLASLNAIMLQCEEEMAISKDVAEHSKAIHETLLKVTTEKLKDGYKVTLPDTVTPESV